ncbi:hypothetical protein M2263_000485 [Providencia alcalifaciens]|nr:hypothetical protein [Providencia alcalifaciens]
MNNNLFPVILYPLLIYSVFAYLFGILLGLPLIVDELLCNIYTYIIPKEI